MSDPERSWQALRGDTDRGEGASTRGDGGGYAPDWVESVRPDEIPRQRARGWPDFHPEDFCHRCGHRNPVWCIDDRWPFDTLEDTILCPSCFARQTGRPIDVTYMDGPSGSRSDLAEERHDAE